MLADEIKRLRIDRGMTQVALAKALGVKQPYIAQLETNKIPSISFAFAAKIGEVFGLPMNHFAPFLAPGVQVPPPPLPVSNKIKLPLLGDASAGGGIDAPAEPGEIVEFPSEFAGAECALRIRGSSMIQAGIRDGDFVAIRKNESPEDGEIVFAWVHSLNGHVIKMLRKDAKRGAARLLPMDEFDKGDILTLKAEDHIYGVYYGLIRYPAKQIIGINIERTLREREKSEVRDAS